jgi:hypothetical protein
LEVFNSGKASSPLRTLKIPLLSLTILLSLGSTLGVSQQSDEEKRLRDLFLKSRQQMEIVPSPTPTPRPTPDPAPSPVKQSFAPPSPEAAPHKTTQPNPTSKPVERKQPEATTAPSQVQPQSTSTPLPQRETPTPTPSKKHRWFFFGGRDDSNSIVVQKSGAEEEKDLVPPTGGGDVHWQYLTPAVRKAIDDARVARNRWKYIIVHNSGTRQGNARIFDYYHRHVRKMPNGLAYHFAIYRRKPSMKLWTS